MNIFKKKNKIHITDIDKRATPETREKMRQLNEELERFRGAGSKTDNTTASAIILKRKIVYGDGVIVEGKDEFIPSPTIERRQGILIPPTPKKIEELHPTVFTGRVVEEEVGCCGRFFR